MKAYILAAVVVILAGCITTPAEKARKIAVQHHATCSSYGLSLGSDQYVQCRMLLEEIEVQKRANEIASGAALMNYGTALQQMSQPRPLVRPTVTCTTYGNVTNCF